MTQQIEVLTVAAFFLLQTTNTKAEERRQAVFDTKNSSVLFDETPISEIRSDSLMSCSQRCARDKRCKSANFKLDEKTCSLLDKTKNTHPRLFGKQVNAIHLEKINSDLGSTPEMAVPSCKALPGALHLSGVYWVDPDGGSHANAFKVYCETDTDGGGWTLVWSYTFTDYQHFWTSNNAVTPRPNWPVWSADVPISTTPPANETDYNAIEFPLWRQFGKEFLIKSNINNWLVCSPDTGSLVEWQDGDVICKIVKRVTDTCSDGPPISYLTTNNCGPNFKRRNGANSGYYHFDGCTGNRIPTHDPCGQYSDNGLKDVDNPHGNIFIR
ncbi:uncharacterized protein LOC144667318 [Oculina patagonica]